ncbi:hypothetical protein [Hyphomicrobium sp. NDB2Meth4]|uniref:hypothetical protein n=1 Tax=Hyphomicrobium sp. NDB2Meth4 TaxID=1892846 RepID=UPI000930E22C|nr:hypothetical protein [Hyphomicrobium sp. NDB2Meth4]
MPTSLKKRAVEKELTLSSSQLASILADPPLSRTVMRALATDGYLVEVRHGTFDLAASVQGYQRFLDGKQAARLDDDTVSAVRLASILGIGDRWMRILADQGFLTKSGRAAYNLAASVQGYIRFVREAERQRARPGPKPRRD